MFSCPTDDIHSVYLDGELPLSYVNEYERHVSMCEKCAQRQESLRRIRKNFAEDSKNIALDSHFMDESYSRLMTKMSYSKNTRRVRPFLLQKTLVGFSAAAAVLLAVVLPFGISDSKRSAASMPLSQLELVERPQMTAFSNKNIIGSNVGGNLSRTVGIGSLKNTSLADVDVFRPNFDDSNTIRISVPGMELERAGVMDVMLPSAVLGILP